MTKEVRNSTSHFGLIFILGLLSMLMPLSIDMYLPSLPSIAKDFGVSDGAVQLTISAYLISFSIGQLLYGPLADAYGRKRVMLVGLTFFVIAAFCCALSTSIEQLIAARLLNGVAAASASVIINALMRDLFSKEEFSKMMSLVTLIMTLAPLLAPILGGIIIVWFSWHVIFVILAIAALLGLILVGLFIRETLPPERRQRLHLASILRNFVTVFRHRQAMCYILASSFSAAGMFSFLGLGPFVYIDLHHIPAEHFGYYSAVNIVFLIVMTAVNTRYVKEKGTSAMLTLGLTVQFIFGLWMIVSSMLGLGFWALMLGVAGFVGCISMVSSNAMAIILENYPYIAGTVASIIGTFRFGLSAIVGGILALISNQAMNTGEFAPVNMNGISSKTEFFMVGSMFICVTLSMLFFSYSKYRDRIQRKKST